LFELVIEFFLTVKYTRKLSLNQLYNYPLIYELTLFIYSD